MKTITEAAELACFFGSHAQVHADLSLAIDEKPNTVLMLGLDCSPNGSVWTNIANFWLFFNRQALGYFGLVFGTVWAGNLKKIWQHCLLIFCYYRRINMD